MKLKIILLLIAGLLSLTAIAKAQLSCTNTAASTWASTTAKKTPSPTKAVAAPPSGDGDAISKLSKTPIPSPIAVPTKIELTGGAEIRLTTVTSNIDLAPSPNTISIAVSPLASIRNEGGDSQASKNHPTFWSMMVDGAAALFGVFSAAFAVLVAVVTVVAVIKGIRDYQNLKKELAEEIRNRVSTDIAQTLINTAIGNLQNQVDTRMNDYLRGALTQAEQRLSEEATRHATDLANSSEFYDEISRRVAALQQPQQQRTTQNEFEEPNT